MALKDTVKLLENKPNAERREMIRNFLNKNKIKFVEEPFTDHLFKGVNIICEFGKGKKDIIVSAHYDKFMRSPGANDNGSGVACLFEIVKKLKRYRPKNKVKAVFFDREDTVNWCLGSKAYISMHGINSILGQYNLEMVGMGDAIGIWNVLEEDNGNPVLDNLVKTIKQKKLRAETAGQIPGFLSDHSPFRIAGLQSAYSVTTVKAEDVEFMRKFIKYPTIKKWFMFAFERKKLPLLFQAYHNHLDNSSIVEEKTLKNVTDVVYDAIVKLDKKVK